MTRPSACLLLPWFLVPATATPPIAVDTLPRAVRIDPGEAWVKREGVASLPSAGVHRLEVGGLPRGLTLDDLRLELEGPSGCRIDDLRIGPVAAPAADPSEARARKEAVLARQRALDAVEARRVVGAKSLELLAQLARREGKEPRGEDLVAFTRTFEARSLELHLQEAALNRERDAAKEDLAAAKRALQALAASARADRSRVLIDLHTPTPGRVRLNLRTRTADARWSPAYEVHASEDGSRVELVLVAQVSQRSSEDWNGVALELSTVPGRRQLALPADPPPLALSWQAFPSSFHPAPRGGEGIAAPMALPAALPMEDRAKEGRSMALGATVATREAAADLRPALEPPAQALLKAGGLAQVFAVSGPRDLPADGLPHRIRLAARTCTAERAWIAIPRTSTQVFQVLRYRAGEGWPQFPGAPSATFLGSLRIGQGSWAASPVGESSELSLGPDETLRAACRSEDRQEPTRKLKLQRTQSRVGTTVTTRDASGPAVLSWALTEHIHLANASAEPRIVEVRDRKILASQDAVKVACEGVGGVPLKESPTLRTWKLEVPAAGEASLRLRWSLTAPKDGQLAGLQELGFRALEVAPE